MKKIICFLTIVLAMCMMPVVQIDGAAAAGAAAAAVPRPVTTMLPIRPELITPTTIKNQFIFTTQRYGSRTIEVRPDGRVPSLDPKTSRANFKYVGRADYLNFTLDELERILFIPSTPHPFLTGTLTDTANPTRKWFKFSEESVLIQLIPGFQPALGSPNGENINFTYIDGNGRELPNGLYHFKSDSANPGIARSSTGGKKGLSPYIYNDKTNQWETTKTTKTTFTVDPRTKQRTANTETVAPYPVNWVGAKRGRLFPFPIANLHFYINKGRVVDHIAPAFAPTPPVPHPAAAAAAYPGPAAGVPGGPVGPFPPPPSLVHRVPPVVLAAAAPAMAPVAGVGVPGAAVAPIIDNITVATLNTLYDGWYQGFTTRFIKEKKATFEAMSRAERQARYTEFLSKMQSMMGVDVLALQEYKTDDRDQPPLSLEALTKLGYQLLSGKNNLLIAFNPTKLRFVLDNEIKVYTAPFTGHPSKGYQIATFETNDSTRHKIAVLNVHLPAEVHGTRVLQDIGRVQEVILNECLRIIQAHPAYSWILLGDFNIDGLCCPYTNPLSNPGHLGSNYSKVAEIFAKANVQIAPENGYATAFNTNENQLAFYDYILFSATSLSLDNRPALIWPNPDPKSLWNSLLTHGMYQETGRAWFSDHAMVQATFYFKDILDAREAAGAAAKAAAAGAPGGPGFPPVGSAGAVGGLPAPGPAAYAALFNAINTGNEAAAIGLLRQNSQLMHIKQGASSPLRLAIEKGLENVVKVLLDLQALQYEDASLIRDLAEKIKNEKASTPLAALAQKIYDMIPKPLTGPVSPSPAPLAGAAAAVLSVREPARPAPHATGPVVPIAAIPAGASPAPLTGIQSKAVANAREIDEYFAAVKKDDQDTVTKMLKKYPDLIQIIRDGTTSLQEAIKYGQETIVEQLLKLGALTYEQDRRTILDVARTARDRNQGDPGEYAVALRILEDIERALGERSSAVAGAPPARPAPIPAKAPVTLPSPVAASAALPEPSASDVVALFDAIARDDADTVERLIKTNSRLWDSQNATGKLPEAVVITGSKRNVFDRLMNMNLIGQDKSLIHGTALAMDVNNSDASRYIDRRVREHLGLLAAATPTAAVPAPAARPALGAPAVAIAPAGPVPVAAPLTRPGAASAQELLFKAVQDNDIEAVKKIIKANPSLVNSKNEANVTPLMIAITNGKNEMVAALVKDGGTDWGITGGPKNVSIEALAEQMAKLYPENEGAQKINALIKLFTASAPGAVPAAVPVTAVRPSAPLLVLPSADTSRTGLVVPSFGAMSHAIASGNVHEVRKILQEKPEETRSNLEIFIKEAQRAETENKKVATNYQEIIALLNTR